MSILTKIFAGGASAVIDSVGGIVKAVAGDKSAKEENTHSEQEAASDQWAAESAAQGSMENRTWWDSLVDGLNRLMRPIGFFGTVALFSWAGYDSVEFSATMLAFQLVPEWLALIAGQIILLTYGGRMLDKWSMKGPSVSQAASVLKAQAEIRALGKAATPVQTSPATAVNVYESQDRVADQTLESDMASSRPLPLPSIVEWNRRNNPNAG